MSLKPESSVTEEEPIDSDREQPDLLQILCLVDLVDMLPGSLAGAVM